MSQGITSSEGEKAAASMPASLSEHPNTKQEPTETRYAFGDKLKLGFDKERLFLEVFKHYPRYYYDTDWEAFTKALGFISPSSVLKTWNDLQTVFADGLEEANNPPNPSNVAPCDDDKQLAKDKIKSERTPRQPRSRKRAREATVSSSTGDA
ncbi:MAG: hypothetical protein M1833_005081 [Piccolia ochrophora]|nr:MAG: hypothetical protein M1833_005081 [Piccolia ochrophora]